nr:FtsX-like permease family protein [uncultured Acetatifactor sp.]
MNKKSLIPRMALQSIKKNSATYLPYMGICIFAVFTYFVFDLILNNNVMETIPRAGYALMLMSIGFWLLGVIMVPFLYYTNSFLIKRRKKELGLYSILGMEKKHIGMMMLVETGVIYVIVTAAAVGLGLLFSRLLFLLLLNLAKLPVRADFSFSPKALTDTLAFFGVVSGINLAANLFQVGKANPIELMSESKKGEREPRHILLWSAVGIAALGAGYKIAIEAEMNSMIFTDFFLAVLLVVAGTHFLFTSGSIALLRFLKKRKKFYYRAENFVTVSGMLYRMKKSAASLVNICIFGTMVIITAVCTVSMYLGIPSIQSFAYPYEMEIHFMDAAFTGKQEWLSRAEQTAADHNVTMEKRQYYSYVACPVEKQGNAFIPRSEQTQYQDMFQLYLMTLEEFNRLENTSYELSPGEIFIFSSGADFSAPGNREESQHVKFLNMDFSIRMELQECSVAKKAQDNNFGGIYLAVVENQETLAAICAEYGVDSAASGSFIVQLTPAGKEEDITSFVQQIEQLAAQTPGFASFQWYAERMMEQESMYGGLLFIGIFFGLIFLICLLVIMYYKQVTEGFEDQSSFEIMQKVGMSDSEVRSTIKKQILLVFFLPLAGAFCHTAAGTNMVVKLLGALNLFEPELITLSAVGVSAVFAVLYVFCYRLTAKTYYRIVRWR